MNIHDVDNPNIPVDKQDVDEIDDFIGNRPNVINVGDEDSPKWLEVPDETNEDKWEADAYVDSGGGKLHYFIIRFNDLSEKTQQRIKENLFELDADCTEEEKYQLITEACDKAWCELGVNI